MQFLEKSCMRGLGYDYLPSLSASYVATGTRILQEYDSREWGISDLSVASRYGYHLPPWARATSAQVAAAGTPPDEVLPLMGATVVKGRAVTARAGSKIPSGGCRGWAGQVISKAGINPSGATPALIGQISNNSFAKTGTDPRVLAVFAKWSSCMAAHGYHYTSPFQPYATEQPGAAASAAEIQAAVTDVRCKFQANLLGVTYAVQSRYQDQMIGQHAAELAGLRQAFGQQERALARLVRRYGLTSRPGQ
jgi:hypothetical protein